MPSGLWTRATRSGVAPGRVLAASALVGYALVWTVLIMVAGLLVGRLLSSRHTLVLLAAEIATVGVLVLCAGSLALPTVRVVVRLGARRRTR